LLQCLNDIRIGSAQRHDRADHFIDVCGNDTLFRLSVRRKLADSNLVALHAVYEDRLTGIEHKWQL
jgi:hypothetical protein